MGRTTCRTNSSTWRAQQPVYLLGSSMLPSWYEWAERKDRRVSTRSECSPCHPFWRADRPAARARVCAFFNNMIIVFLVWAFPIRKRYTSCGARPRNARTVGHAALGRAGVALYYGIVFCFVSFGFCWCYCFIEHTIN